MTSSAAWPQAHADALDEPDDPGNVADEQADQPAYEQVAWLADEQPGRPADEQDAWPGVAPPAGWFLRRPGESDPSPEPAPDYPAASAAEDAADDASLPGEWFSPGDGPDADISEDEYEYDENEDVEDGDPLDAGISAAAEGSQEPPGDLESNGPWPVLQPRAASQPPPSPHREPDGSWAQSAAGATMALQGRAGDPRFAEPARTSASPWQRSQRLWGESGIQWEHRPAAAPEPAPVAPHVPHQEPSPRPPQPRSYAPQPHSNQAQPQPHQYPPQPRQAQSYPPRSYPPQPSPAQRLSAGRHIRSGPRPVEQPNSSWPGNLRHPLSAPVYTEPELGTDERDAMDERSAPPLWSRTPHQDSAARADTRQSSDTMLLEPPMPDTGPTRVHRGRRRFRAATLALPVVVLVAVALLALALLTGHGPKLGPLESSQKGTPGTGTQQSGLVTAALGTYAGQQARGIFQTVNRIVSSGNTIVAAGAQTSGGVARQQFFVSANGGASWQLAPVHAPGGGQPALGYTAGLLAGGPGGWLAIGSQAIWTSPNGLTWTLAATHGIEPQLPGDQVWVVTRTADGFLAAGEAAAGSGTTQAVIWTSPDGLTWHRTTDLTAPGARVLNISYATWHGTDTVIAGALSNGQSGAWLSTNGGTSWTPVTIPAGNGAGPAITGLGFDASGLIAVRNGRTPSGMQDGVSYFSPNGQAWQYAATIGATGGLSPRVVKGSAYGFVVTGTDATGNLVAYTSAGTGTAWQPTASLGSAATQAVMGAAVAPAGTIIAIGSTVASNLGQQPVFLEADTAGSVRQVPLAGIPGATIPQLGVNGLAVADGQQIAVGSADGYPAIWRKAEKGVGEVGGSPWTLVTPVSLASAAGPRLASLSSVAHGAEGWIAVGVPGPTVLTSTDGTTWQATTGPIARDLAGVAGVAVTAGPTGYVIVGKLVAKGGACVADVWYSPNLIDWTRAHDVNDATGSSQVLAVAAQPHGFLSVGSHNGQPAVWTTVNGSSWTTTLLPTPPGDTGGVLDQVAVNGSRVVAMGEQMAGTVTTPFVELSTDGGKSWAQIQLTSPGPNTVVTALTASGNGFTAAGQYGQPGQQDAAVWTSTSGVNWQVSDVIGPGVGGQNEIAALASSGATVTGIGSIQTQQSQESVVLTLHSR